MKRLALAALLFLAIAPAAGAQAVVRGEWVSLGDVAPVTGDAAKILVAPAPPPGQTLALDPVFLTSVAKKSGVILALPLDQPILVSRAATIAPTAPVAKVAKAAPTPPQARTAPTAGATQPVNSMVLVLVRDVQRGQRIAASDLDWQAPQNGIKPRNPPLDIDAAVGLEARRALMTGTSVQMGDLKSATVIRKGDAVRLVYASEGLRLTTDGQAQGDAAAGEPVRVLNRFSKRSIDAVATGEGEARVSR